MFSFLMALGVVSGLAWLAWLAPDEEKLNRVDAGLALLFGALLGSRLLYVAAHWGYYQQNWLEMLQVWQGGLSAAGAVLGGCLALWLLTRGMPVSGSTGRLADAMLPLAGALVIASWLAAWWAGSAYGPLASLNGFGLALPARDEWGAIAPRFPTQLWGVIFTLGGLWNLLGLPQRWPGWAQHLQTPGRRAAGTVLGLGLQLFVLSYLRADPVWVINGLRPDAWGALCLILLGALWWLNSFRLKEVNP